MSLPNPGSVHTLYTLVTLVKPACVKCFCAKIISSILNIVAVFHALIPLAVKQTGTAVNVFVIKMRFVSDEGGTFSFFGGN